MAILPDEIQDITNTQDAAMIAYEYIKYMREMIEFWGGNRMKEIEELKTRVNALEQEE